MIFQLLIAILDQQIISINEEIIIRVLVITKIVMILIKKFINLSEQMEVGIIGL
jgi:hypothetical protein